MLNILRRGSTLPDSSEGYAPGAWHEAMDYLYATIKRDAGDAFRRTVLVPVLTGVAVIVAVAVLVAVVAVGVIRQ